MRVHLVQFDIAWENPPANWATVEAMIDKASIPPGGLIVLPELGDVGFSMAVDRTTGTKSDQWAAQLAQRCACWVLHGWAEMSPSGNASNVAGLAAPNGQIVGQMTKLHPFSPMKEAQAYAPGAALTLFREVAGATICPLICYDLRFPEVFRAATFAGAEVLVVMANWPTKRAAHWKALAQARAIENQTAVLACNRTGADPHTDYSGDSMIISADGTVIAEAGPEATILTADLDLQAQASWRQRFPALQDARTDWHPLVPVQIAGPQNTP